MPAHPTAFTPLFEGLDAAALEAIHRHMRPRHFAARAVICREGEPGDSLFVLQRGVAQVTVGPADNPRPVARLRRGDVFGEMSLITREPRSATVVANVPTDALELTREAFAALLARYPVILENLNRILVRRLAHRTAQQAGAHRGEAVVLVTTQPALAADVIAAAQSASPRRVAALDLSAALPQSDIHLEEPTVAGALGVLDDLLTDHGTVVIVTGPDREDLPLLLEHVDRGVVLAAEPEAGRLASVLGPLADRLGIALLTAEPRPAPKAVGGLRVVRALDPARPARDVAWLGRHIARTKLGLALGAGGAKGYAHVAALYVLEEHGYTVDYVAGSSIGAMVGAWLALGHTAAEIEAIMRNAFTPENVAAMFKLAMSGMSAGLDVHTRVCRETTADRTFADLQIPLVAMAVDLNTRQPAPIADGPIWQALLASTALAGMFPPYQRDGQRLVDGLALVPVPVGAVRDAGADVTVAVNIMSRETLPAWPGQASPPPPPPRSGARMLDTLLEVMDLSQIDSSIRHAAQADVVITPRFGPGSWRDFHLADLFLAAGRAAAEEQLASLRALARPQSA
ncbi:MAG TPA: cyclic nucleotide-binding and patatin-like phospholipase domain-containing protein [Gemmataceae bacterium]|nr:cyclic nucleotide-binding and patatin-like phospholipase domain-containing protein [Gemmataceae bacterium]